MVVFDIGVSPTLFSPAEAVHFDSRVCRSAFCASRWSKLQVCFLTELPWKGCKEFELCGGVGLQTELDRAIGGWRALLRREPKAAFFECAADRAHAASRCVRHPRLTGESSRSKRRSTDRLRLLRSATGVSSTLSCRHPRRGACLCTACAYRAVRTCKPQDRPVPDRRRTTRFGSLARHGACRSFAMLFRLTKCTISVECPPSSSRPSGRVVGAPIGDRAASCGARPAATRRALLTPGTSFFLRRETR